jgi:hypothetical protein
MKMQVNLYGTSKYVVSDMMNINIANGIKNKNCKVINKQKQTLLEFNTVNEFYLWWAKTYSGSETGLEEGIYVHMDFY